MTELEKNNYNENSFLLCCKNCAYGELHDDGVIRIDPDWYDCCFVCSYVKWDGVCDKFATTRHPKFGTLSPGESYE